MGVIKGEKPRLLLKFYEGGSLADVHERNGGKFDIDTTRFYAGQLYRGLQDMHAKGYVHKDLKPVNTLVDRKGLLYLHDFGLSEKIDDGRITNHEVGTMGFMAPEHVEFLCAEPEVMASKPVSTRSQSQLHNDSCCSCTRADASM